MAVALFFDVHVDHAIVNQLRLRQVEVLTAQEAEVTRLPDDLLLEHTSDLGRPLVTHDIRLYAMAEKWLLEGGPFCGVVFGHLLQVTIGQCVRDLELLAKATEPQDWESALVRLPL